MRLENKHIQFHKELSEHENLPMSAVHSLVRLEIYEIYEILCIIMSKEAFVSRLNSFLHCKKRLNC